MLRLWVVELLAGALFALLMLCALDVWPDDYWLLSRDRMSYTWCTDAVKWPVLQHCTVIYRKNTL